MTSLLRIPNQVDLIDTAQKVSAKMEVNQDDLFGQCEQGTSIGKT